MANKIGGAPRLRSAGARTSEPSQKRRIASAVMDPEVYDALVKDAERQERPLSFVLSRIARQYYAARGDVAPAQASA